MSIENQTWNETKPNPTKANIAKAEKPKENRYCWTFCDTLHHTKCVFSTVQIASHERRKKRIENCLRKRNLKWVKLVAFCGGWTDNQRQCSLAAWKWVCHLCATLCCAAHTYFIIGQLVFICFQMVMQYWRLWASERTNRHLKSPNCHIRSGIQNLSLTSLCTEMKGLQLLKQ